MDNKTERPRIEDWAHIEKKNYFLRGECTAVFDEQVKNCKHMQPGFYGSLCAYQQLATGRCLNTKADETFDAMDKVVELNEVGSK